MEYIKSASNLRIKRVALLKNADERKQTNTFVAEGVRVVLDAPVTPKEVSAGEMTTPSVFSISIPARKSGCHRMKNC